jgi:5,10-methylenetetrahydrofolate reductase
MCMCMQFVLKIKLEGGIRKPVWQDMFIVQFFLCPYYLYLWGKKMHRRHISKEVSWSIMRICIYTYMHAS